MNLECVPQREGIIVGILVYLYKWVYVVKTSYIIMFLYQ